MERTIKRGSVVIGQILFPEALCMGLEVFVKTAFPESDPDGDDQFESADRAENFLHLVYEAHCEANGLAPEPRDAEIVADESYDAREIEASWSDLWSDDRAPSYPTLDQVEAEMSERDLAANLRGFEDALPRDDSDDDLPF